MNKQRYEKFFILLAILIAILNMWLIVKLFLDDTAYEIFTILEIITIAIQICIIIISTIIINLIFIMNNITNFLIKQYYK